MWEAPNRAASYLFLYLAETVPFIFDSRLENMAHDLLFLNLFFGYQVTEGLAGLATLTISISNHICWEFRYAEPLVFLFYDWHISSQYNIFDFCYKITRISSILTRKHKKSSFFTLISSYQNFQHYIYVLRHQKDHLDSATTSSSYISGL